MLVEERRAVMLQMPFFYQIKATLANIQPENLQNVEKKRLGKKLQESMG